MLHLQKLALGLVGASLLGSVFASDDSDVHALTKDTFKDFIKEHELVLAEFYAPWCGHCKALAPEYEAAAKELKAKDIPLVKVDCTEETDLCQEFEVQGYPTLKVFRGLDNVKQYGGARKADAYVPLLFWLIL
jgi:protein disulfide-isomerase A1